MDLERVVEVRRTSAAGEMSLAEAIEQEMPVLGRAAHGTSFLRPAH